VKLRRGAGDAERGSMGHGAFSRSDEMLSDGPRGSEDAVAPKRSIALSRSDLARHAVASDEAEEAEAASLLEHIDGKMPLDRPRAGRRRSSPTEGRDGRHARSRLPQARGTIDLAFDATLRAAAPAQRSRPSTSTLAVVVAAEDLREKQRVRKVGRLLVFVVDLSGSMAEAILAVARRAALLLLEEAYVKRDRVAMVAFRDVFADVLFAPTRSVDVARRCLLGLATGGKTPLSFGLVRGHTLIARALRSDPRQEPVMVVITDGKANVGSRAGHRAVLHELERTTAGLRAERRLRSIVFDATEDGKDDFEAMRLAESLDAPRLRLHRLRDLDQPSLRRLLARL
jgi:magnesium chelatase subunit D